MAIYFGILNSFLLISFEQQIKLVVFINDIPEQMHQLKISNTSFQPHHNLCNFIGLKDDTQGNCESFSQ